MSAKRAESTPRVRVKSTKAWRVEGRMQRLDKDGRCRACGGLACEPGPYFVAGELRPFPLAGRAFFIYGTGHTRAEAIDKADEKRGRRA